MQGLRGWGRGLREAVAAWYAMPAGKLALQGVKYQQRDGWSHRDLLRLAHPKPLTPQHEAIYYWMVKGWEWAGEEPHPDEALRTIWAFERAKRAKTAREVIGLIEDHRLPRVEPRLPLRPHDDGAVGLLGDLAGLDGKCVPVDVGLYGVAHVICPRGPTALRSAPYVASGVTPRSWAPGFNPSEDQPLLNEQTIVSGGYPAFR